MQYQTNQQITSGNKSKDYKFPLGYRAKLPVG